MLKLTHENCTHHPSTPVVVQVHHRTGVFHIPIPSVHKVFGELYAVVDVVAASAPVKVTPFVAGSPALVAVAAADLQLPLTAGPGDGVDHSC